MAQVGITDEPHPSPPASGRTQVPVSAAQASEQLAFEIETEADATDEDCLRLEGLHRVIPNPAGGWLNVVHLIWEAAQGSARAEYPALDHEAARALIVKLESGITTGVPAPTLASSLHMRSVRQSFLGAAIPALEPFSWENLRTFTMVNGGWVVTPEELERYPAKRFKAQFRTHLNRIGVTADSGFLLAFFHGEFDPVARLYTLHVHGVTTVANAALLTKLVGNWGYVYTRTRGRPLVRKRINDPLRQLSYLLKAYWPSRAVRELPNGSWKRDRVPQRIPEPYHSQVLLWMDRQRLSDITVMIGGWSRRRGGSDAMRRLYFSTVEG